MIHAQKECCYNFHQVWILSNYQSILRYNVCTADTLRLPVTLTVDQSIWPGHIYILCFDLWLFLFEHFVSVYWLLRDQTQYQILVNSKKPRRSIAIGTLNICAPSVIFSLIGSEFLQFLGGIGPIMHQHVKFRDNRAMHSRVIDDRTNFPGLFSRCNFTPNSQN